MYICTECQLLLDETQLKHNRCPIITNHKNPHRPLMKVDDDIAHSILRCIKEGYNVTNFSGAKRNCMDDSANEFDRLYPKIPYITFGFASKVECEDFYKRCKPIRHLMQNWNIPGLERMYRVDEELHVISDHVLHSKKSHKHVFEGLATVDFYEIRFVGGGTKFSPAILWDTIYFRDTNEEQKSEKEILLKDFYDSYFDYCKDFFGIFDVICM